MKHKVGQLVINRKLGLGKVLQVSGNTVTVFFKDQKENPRNINVAVVPMTLAKDQSDPSLDGSTLLKRAQKKLGRPRKAAKRLIVKAGVPQA